MMMMSAVNDDLMIILTINMDIDDEEKLT